MSKSGPSETFREERGEDRYLRATWHPSDGQVVFSLWRGSACAGTFRLDVSDVPDMIALLRNGLVQAHDQVHDGHTAERPITLVPPPGPQLTDPFGTPRVG